jgi:hypothetical protein
MNLNPISLSFRFLIFLVGSMVLFACSPPVSEPTPSSLLTITPDSISTEIQTPPTETEKPTLIPSQTKVILVAPPDVEFTQFEGLAATLAELAEAEELDFEVRSSLSQQDLSPDLKIVAAIPPDPGLAELAQAAPAIQFLGIAIPDLEPAPNLSIIDTQEISPDRMGFLAGYLAAVVAPEWRVGVISTNDTPQGISQRQGFLNGAIFFCGLCRQSYPPFNTYPMYVEAPSGSSPQEWQTVGDILIEQAAQTAFIASEVSDESLFGHLALAGINLIGTVPPPPGLRDQWIATIGGDISAALQAVWPALITGQGGARLPAPLTVTHINPDLFSPGRQRLVDNLISELSDGFIDTGVETTTVQP